MDEFLNPDLERREQERNERIENYEARLKKAYRDVYNTPAGRIMIEDLLDQAFIFKTSFTGNSKTFFQEGARALGLYMLEMLNLVGLSGLERLQRDAGVIGGPENY